jgi:hypothetical protein
VRVCTAVKGETVHFSDATRRGAQVDGGACVSIAGTCAQQTSEVVAVSDAEFGENAVEVSFNGTSGDIEPIADLAVGQARRDECGDFALSVGDL